MKTLKEKHKELCKLIGEDEAVRKLHGFYDRAIRKAILDRELKQNADFGKMVIRIIEHLNMVTGFHFRPTNPETRKLIRARLKEKYTFEDFRKVHIEKARQWFGTDMEKYLRPSTLYRASHFEGYIQEYDRYKAKIQGKKKEYSEIEKKLEEENRKRLEEIRRTLAEKKRMKV